MHTIDALRLLQARGVLPANADLDEIACWLNELLIEPLHSQANYHAYRLKLVEAALERNNLTVEYGHVRAELRPAKPKPIRADDALIARRRGFG